MKICELKIYNLRMFTITPEVASLRVFTPHQRLEGDDDDDETTYGCLPSRQRSRAYECLPPRQRLEGDYDDDDETTYGCLPSRQRSRAYECLPPRQRLDVR